MTVQKVKTLGAGGLADDFTAAVEQLLDMGEIAEPPTDPIIRATA